MTRGGKGRDDLFDHVAQDADDVADHVQSGTSPVRRPKLSGKFIAADWHARLLCATSSASAVVRGGEGTCAPGLPLRRRLKFAA